MHYNGMEPDFKFWFSDVFKKYEKIVSKILYIF